MHICFTSLSRPKTILKPRTLTIVSEMFSAFTPKLKGTVSLHSTAANSIGLQTQMN